MEQTGVPHDAAGDHGALALDTLRAAIDRIIPRDDFPGAWEAGAGHYILRQLAGDLRHLAPLLRAGFDALDAEAGHTYGRPFAAIDAEQQDVLLARVEIGNVHAFWPLPPAAFLSMLVELTNEGYYGDPGNGGNRDEAAWRMIGYRP
jgi:gluconate 2-dehydrogenase gamma chain